MFRKISVLTLLYIICTSAANAQTIKGQVTDYETNEPVAGATVTVENTVMKVVTDTEGHYEIGYLPTHTKLKLVFNSLGYKTAIFNVETDSTKTLNVHLHPGAIEMDEVIVKGYAIWSQGLKSSSEISSIDENAIQETGATNLIDGLIGLPGVSQITTGNAVSKPVIRGQSGARVVTMSQGVRQEGQQWGADHGIEIDQASVGLVEVVKGPATLFYGADAIGGVVNVLDPAPAPLNTVQANIRQSYSTNDGLTMTNAQVSGNQDGFIYRIAGTYKNAANYFNQEGRTDNTAFNENNIAAMMGLQKDWGTAHVSYSRFNTKIGTPEDGHIHHLSSKGNPLPGARHDDHDHDHIGEKTRDLHLPYQHVTHQKLAVNSDIKVGEGHLQSTVGLQRSNRNEYDHSETDPEIELELNTFTADVKYFFPEYNNWLPIIGASGMVQTNNSISLIPSYNMYAGGVFGYVKKEWEKGTFDVGLRVEGRSLNDYKDTSGEFERFKNSFGSVAGSVGGTYSLVQDVLLKGSVSRGFRAPNISELSAHGAHGSSFRYEVGNPDLSPETNVQIDGAVVWDNALFRMEASGFYNRIKNYIYLQNTNGDEIETGDGDILPVFYYVQGLSVLKGFEFTLNVPLLKPLSYENVTSYVRGVNLDNGDNLPFIPQAKMINTLKYRFDYKNTQNKGRFSNAFMGVSVVSNFRQDKVDPFETASAGYTLLNVTLSTDLNNNDGKKLARLYITGNNITNTFYIDHLSQFKLIDYGNMGANVTFGASIPLAWNTK